MDSETIAILTIVFGTPVTIVAIVCTYNLLKHWIDRKNPPAGGHTAKAGRPNPTSHELTLKAENLKRRLNNLEEILQAEKQNGGAA